MTEQELRSKIEELGPGEYLAQNDEIGEGLQKVVRNNERMRLRIELFDLLMGEE